MADSFIDTLKKLYPSQGDNYTDDEIDKILDLQDSGDLQKQIVQQRIKDKASPLYTEEFPGPKAPLQTWGVSEHPEIPTEIPMDVIGRANKQQADVDRTGRLQAAQDQALQARAQDRTNPLPSKTGAPFSMKSPFYQEPPKPLSDADQRKALLEDAKSDESSILNNVMAGIAGFGAGVAGRDVGSGFRTAKEASTAKSRMALAEFDKASDAKRRDFIDSLQLKQEGRADKQEGRLDKKDAREEKAYADARDPNSEISKAAQQMILELNPKFDPETLSRVTAEKAAMIVPSIKFKLENTYKLDKEAAAAEERKVDNERAERGIDANNALARASLGLRQSSDSRDAKFRADNETHNRQQEEQNRKDKETKERTPSDKQNEELTNIVDALRANDAILASTEGETAGAGTGPIVGRIVPDALTSDAGQQSRTNIRDNRITLRKAISGSGFSQSEAAEYERLLPSESDTVGQMKSKSEARKKLLERKAKSQLEVMAPTKDVSKYESVPELRAQLPAKPKSTEPPKEKVIGGVRYVLQPNGKYKAE